MSVERCLRNTHKRDSNRLHVRGGCGNEPPELDECAAKKVL